MSSAKEIAIPDDQKMAKIVSLCKRRGFIFQSSEIYGGLKSSYDYGPLGVELKRNIMNEWWRNMVYQREDIVGIDASIIMHPQVWVASGHAAGFADPLVDCHISKERFRADKAPRPEVGDELHLECTDKGQAKSYRKFIQDRYDIELHRDGKVLKGLKVIDTHKVGFFAEKDDEEPTATFDFPGYVSPTLGCPFLSEERDFNLMFHTSLGAVNPRAEVATTLAKITAYEDLIPPIREHFAEELRIAKKRLKKWEKKKKKTPEEAGDKPDIPTIAAAVQDVEDGVIPEDRVRTHLINAVIEQIHSSSMCYLRPETAQAMFVQFANVQKSMSMKVPFGIAQMGKSFRNEVTVEHYIFRSCEFEQMEMEFFVEPGTQGEWIEYWRDERLGWYRKYANHPDNFRARVHEKDELAHYADNCYDIEYNYPWGWDELEGVASRTDYDLKKHAEHSGQRLDYFDPHKEDPETGKQGMHYTPYVVEPAAGATRSVLMFLLDAYAEEEPPEEGKSGRTVLRLHPRLAPIKVAVLPLVKKDGMPEIARKIVEKFFAAGINARYDEQNAIGKRYLRHDEAGTPFCLTVDGQSKEDDTVTIRYRDTREQKRIAIDEAVEVIREEVNKDG